MNGFKKDTLIKKAVQAQMRLPPELRTEHWYNDWQHAVFIISFDHLMRALQQGRSLVAEKLVDKLTVYLYVHFLCEEEGMTWAIHAGHLDPGALLNHQRAHVQFLAHWHQKVQKPFKAGLLSDERLAGEVRNFYQYILEHIDTTDQACYGAKSEREGDSIIDEIAHIAASGLPLSPNMPGAAAVVGACSADAFGLLKPRMLPALATEPLKTLKLAPNLPSFLPDSLRHRIVLGARLPAQPTELARVA